VCIRQADEQGSHSWEVKIGQPLVLLIVVAVTTAGGRTTTTGLDEMSPSEKGR
jgi:hypothetical protein